MPDNDQQQKMDNAANEAEQDLESLPNNVVVPMAKWFEKWYLKAGYKRLGKIVVNIAKKTDRQPI